MTNHPNRKRPFRVSVHGPQTDDLERGFAIVVEGPAASDITIQRQRDLAELIERTLNAAQAAFAPKS